MSVGTLLLVIILLMLVAVVPVWPYSQTWGYVPTTAIGIAVLVVPVLVLKGRT